MVGWSCLFGLRRHSGRADEIPGKYVRTGAILAAYGVRRSTTVVENIVGRSDTLHLQGLTLRARRAFRKLKEELLSCGELVGLCSCHLFCMVTIKELLRSFQVDF